MGALQNLHHSVLIMSALPRKTSSRGRATVADAVSAVTELDLAAIEQSIAVLAPGGEASSKAKTIAYIRLLQRIGCLPPQGFERLQVLCKTRAQEVLRSLEATS